MPRFLKRILFGVGILVGAFVVIQLVPYGRDHTNPPVLGEPKWDSPTTRALAVRACFDCHSNQTKWPWYTHVAPFSWVTQRHVNVGREVLNFSEWKPEWTSAYPLAEQSGSQVLRTEMPPRSYRLLHPEAQLSADEKLALARGLHATLGLEWRE
jgi:hypothetical protein